MNSQLLLTVLISEWLLLAWRDYKKQNSAEYAALGATTVFFRPLPRFRGNFINCSNKLLFNFTKPQKVHIFITSLLMHPDSRWFPTGSLHRKMDCETGTCFLPCTWRNCNLIIHNVWGNPVVPGQVYSFPILFQFTPKPDGWNVKSK